MEIFLLMKAAQYLMMIVKVEHTKLNLMRLTQDIFVLEQMPLITIKQKTLTDL